LNTTNRADFNSKIAKNPKEEVAQVNRNSIICGDQKLNHNTIYSNMYNKKVIPRNVQFTPLSYMIVPHNLQFIG